MNTKNFRLSLTMFITTAMVVSVLILTVGCRGRKNQSPTPTPTTEKRTVEVPTPTATPEPVATPTPIPTPKPSPTPEPEVSKIDPMSDPGETGIGRWPFTSERAITAKDLKGLKKKDLELMRNEIYARHGRAFVRKDLRAYFEKQSWYQVDPSYKDDQLTPLENRNIAFIKEHE